MKSVFTEAVQLIQWIGDMTIIMIIFSQVNKYLMLLRKEAQITYADLKDRVALS